MSRLFFLWAAEGRSSVRTAWARGLSGLVEAWHRQPANPRPSPRKPSRAARPAAPRPPQRPRTLRLPSAGEQRANSLDQRIFPRVDLAWDVIKPSALWHRQMASLYNDVRYTRPPLIECRAKCSRPHRHHKQQRGDSIDNQNVLGSFTAPIAREGGFATGGRLHLVHPVSCLGDRSRQGLR
jgi:hypothetical protein